MDGTRAEELVERYADAILRIGYTWLGDMDDAKDIITSLDWVGLALICFVLPAVLCWLFGLFFRRIGWIKEGDLTLE